MSKKLFFLLLVITIVAIAWFLLPINKDKALKQEDIPKDISEKTNKMTQVNDYKPVTELQQISATSKSLEDIKTCEELQSLYENEAAYIKNALADLFVDRNELSGSGGYSSMSQQELDSLVKSEDPTALVISGSKKIWTGIQGMSQRELMSLYNSDKEKYKEFVSNFKIDFNEIKAGEAMLHRAAVRGKLGAFMEMAMLKDVLVRQMMWRELPSDDIYEHLVAQRAYLKLWEQLNANNPEVLVITRNDLLNQSKGEVIQQYNQQYNLKLKAEQLDTDAVQVTKDLVEQWKKERNYIGEEADFRYVPSDLNELSQKMVEVCWQPNK